MQRDGGSSSSSHPHNASVGQRGLPPRITVAPSVFPTGNPSVSPPQHPLAADTPSNNPQWIYTPPAVEGAQTSPPASMIASTSYYDGDQGSQHERTNAQQYQQWVYTSQQSQEQPYRREPQSVSQMQQHQFTFSQGVYSNTGSYNQYPSPGTHSNTGSMEYGNEGPSYQPQGNQVYGSYYPEMLPVTGDTTNSSPENSGPAYHTTTPESTLHSYSTTPDPAYPTQHQQQSQYLQNPPLQPVQLQQPRQHSSQPRSQHYPNSTYSRDIKPNQPQSNTQSLASSQSPTSWTENTRYSSVNTTTPQNQPSSSGTSVTKPSPPTTRPTNLKRQLGAADFTPTAGASSAGGKAAQKRKRRKNNEAQEWAFEEERESDDSDYEDQPGISVGIGGLGVISEGSRGKGMRLPGACTHCKKLKMKCDFPKNDNTCKRCKSGGHVCIVEGRKQRTAPNKREYLLAQIRQKDAIIESLLKQLHNPYIATPLSIASYRMATSPSDENKTSILEWLDRMKSSVQTAGTKSGPRAFLEARDKEEEDSDGESDKYTRTEVQGAVPSVDEDEAAGDGNDADEDTDKLIPDTHVPLGLIANLSLSNNKSKHKKEPRDAVLNDDDLDDDNVGVANETYFMPGPATDLDMRASLIEQHSPPEILVHGLVTPDDVEKLFEIFYKHINPFLSLLDPTLHTPATTFARCPFLFTVICAIASRYYTAKSEIYPIAMHFAKHSAANALIDGWKSVELCQAYILMSVYAVPARRWEEDRSWLYTGLAIRIATDLNLHQVSTIKPQSEKQEREILNKTRVWMICYNIDRSTATQFGKPSTIKEDFIVRGAKDWYKKSKYSLPYDVHLCAYSALLPIVAKFHDEIFSDPSSPSGLNKKVNFRAVTMTYDATLTAYHEEWSKRFEEESDPNDPGSAFRCLLLPFLVSYSRLVMFSFGFQQAFHRGFEQGDGVFFKKCLEAARSVVKIMIESLAPSGYMRFSADGHFVFASFASAFLLKLLRPEFATFLNKEEENEIFDLISRLIQTLSSPKIAIDDRHTPKLYARFLAGLLSRHRRDGATVGRLHPNPPPQTQVAGGAVPGPTASINSFSVSHPTGVSTGRDGSYRGAGGFSHPSESSDTPIYMPEATFAVGTGQINFGADFDITMLGAGFSSDEEMPLATMNAIKNPEWWQNMMMPGFVWPEGSPSPPANIHGSSIYPQNVNMQSQFGIFHASQVPLAM